MRMATQDNRVFLKGEERSPESLFLQFSETHDAKIREELILHHRGLAHGLARKFAYKGKPLESLVSVGTIGLIKAVDRYDPRLGTKFVTYATHVISGEIKRYFRDKGWVLEVPRRLKDLNAAVHKTIEKLTQKHDQSPTIEDIATELRVSREEVIESMEAGYAFHPLSFDFGLNSDDECDISYLNFMAEEDRDLQYFFENFDLKEALSQLPNREQMIIRLFYYEDFSQTQIAKRLAISQMHVSRLLRQAIQRLKKFVKE